ncbi:tetraacyldisaccharide 4'-kinase [Ferrovibrio sp.]|uniref:tetraacyldisaccharide 4'-kinase n=1 Tax=Ferrovibrio sp. TaxID=1917215 RepID=UPI001B3D464B|nr:tetraacyldisaccharide 4'-kinase [Ferrovibrio sp.]MBP7065603.1 tetraacyldisaccharide 4'-kinase [Ferrovibrio sp.]
MPKAPAFWSAGQNSAAAAIWPMLLSPFATLYGIANRFNRAAARPQEIAVPVISIGNLVAGGAGKTPSTIALAQRLRAAGWQPGIVSRGYGGSAAGPLQVDPQQHDAAQVGDEALLLAQATPTWIGRDRPAAARAAARAGCDLVLADDAHQTYVLARDLNILVVDGAQGFGNGMLLPAGPLREGIREGLARSDAIILIGRPQSRVDLGDLPVFTANLLPQPEDAAALRGERVLAFAGIGRPEKFFATLSELGAEIVARHSFPDHAPYAPDTIMRLVEQAVALKAVPVTTAKDALRLPAEARAMVRVLRVALAFEAPEALDAFLAERLNHA